MRLRSGLLVRAAVAVGLLATSTACMSAQDVAVSAAPPSSVINGSGTSTPTVTSGQGDSDPPGRVSFTGVLRHAETGRPLTSQPVTLEVRQRGASAWSTFASVRSNYVGALHHGPEYLDWNSEFRWAFAGNANMGAVTGPSFTVGVYPHINLCCGGTIALGKTHKMNGFLGPAEPGLTALLQLRSGTSWQNAGTCSVNAEGICRLLVTPKKTGKYTYRLFRPADSSLLANAASPQVLTVTRTGR